MKEIGFPISRKENERRRAVVPSDLAGMANPGMCWLEEGFGDVLGIADESWIEAGARVATREEVLARDIICNPKGLDEDMVDSLREGQTLFGWIHAVQGRRITDVLTEKSMTAVAWEDMYEDGVHTFRRNNEIAGEAAIIHAAPFTGRLPCEWKAALLGTGNCGTGALRSLERLGADVEVYPHERMFDISEHLGKYDVLVNTLLWDVFEERLLIRRSDLARMKEGSMIVDISCDAEGMAIESTRPTTVADPVYVLDGVIHYAVDHTPTFFFRSATEAISREIVRFLDALIEGRPDPALENATVIRDGRIIDERISRFQGRRGRR